MNHSEIVSFLWGVADTYKDSGVEWLGKIPVHWEIAPLYARYEVTLGKMLDSKRVTGEFSGPYLRNVDVQWDEVNTEDLPEMDFAPWERERYRLRPGDVLVCEGGEVGRTATWRGEIEECLSVVIEALRTCDLAATEVIAWCSAMLESDRVGFIAAESIEALRTHWQKAVAK